MTNENKQKGFLSPEIVKLSERLAKDPASNLFVSLAEEYIKSGMPEEALVVLMDGLKIHPDFARARVMLGKVYLDKGEFREAKQQFETVIQASPDNLLAHRKLVKIYREEGSIEKAIQSCRVVLNSNPKDEEMKKDLLDLESRQGNIDFAEKNRPKLTAIEQVNSLKNISSSTAEEDPASALELNLVSSEQDVAASKPLEGETGNTIELKEEECSLEEIMDLMGQEGKVEPAAKRGEEELATESLAELYIKQGFYDKGIEVFQALLLKDPANKALLKKFNDATARSKNESKTPPESVETKTERPAPAEMANNPGEGAAIGEVHAEARSKAVEPEPAPSKPSQGKRPNAEKIQKLQAWLEQIKRSRNQ
jgi:tetratricopeptide (TPR) repeat protein